MTATEARRVLKRIKKYNINVGPGLIESLTQRSSDTKPILSNVGLNELIQWANEMSQLHWGVDYTGKIELVNREWKSRAACFAHCPNDKTIQTIRMSSKSNATKTVEHIKGWLLHELVHWRLYNTGLPFRDMCKEFIEECLRVGAYISKARSAQEAFKRHQDELKVIPENDLQRG